MNNSFCGPWWNCAKGTFFVSMIQWIQYARLDVLLENLTPISSIHFINLRNQTQSYFIMIWHDMKYVMDMVVVGHSNKSIRVQIFGKAYTYIYTKDYTESQNEFWQIFFLCHYKFCLIFIISGDGDWNRSPNESYIVYVTPCAYFSPIYEMWNQNKNHWQWTRW